LYMMAMLHLSGQFQIIIPGVHPKLGANEINSGMEEKGIEHDPE